MAGKTKIGGTSYTISGGKTRVSGTVYSIKGGKTRVSGTVYDILFGPDPLQIYLEGDQNLRNGASVVLSTDGDVNFNSDGISMRSYYGINDVWFSWKIPMESIAGYRKMVISLLYVDPGTPADARIGWGNGRYGYNMAYYDPSKYENNGTTKYQEVSYIGATTEKTFELDISSVAGIEEIQFGVKFRGSGSDGSRDGTKTRIKEIRLE